LIGAPPGYVGYEEGGQLTERVRRKPYSVILLDEIEKAHPDVYNTLLQVLDEGHLTDGLGRRVDFKNTVIIMTSNIGVRKVKEFGQGVGFATQSRQAAKKEFERNTILGALKKRFPPEFLNRVDDMIVFNPLEKEHMIQITEIMLKAVHKRLSVMGLSLTVDQKVVEFLAERGFDPEYGARPLARAIQRYLEDAISDFILRNNPKEGKKLSAKMKDEEIIIK